MDRKRVSPERAPRAPRQKPPANGSIPLRRPQRAFTEAPHAQPATEDVALICGKTPDGEGLHVLRKRSDHVEAGLIRPLREGKPIEGDVVRLRPRPDFPLLCDVDVELELPRRDANARGERSELSGPPQVATDDYRRNWDLIWSAAATKQRVAN